MLFSDRRRRSRPAPLLNERGQGLAWLLFAIAGLLWICIEAKGL